MFVSSSSVIKYETRTFLPSLISFKATTLFLTPGNSAITFSISPGSILKPLIFI